MKHTYSYSLRISERARASESERERARARASESESEREREREASFAVSRCSQAGGAGWQIQLQRADGRAVRLLVDVHPPQILPIS